MVPVSLAKPAVSLDPFANDPFFKRHERSTWNACIGKQGDEENYVDGYIEAAIELAGAIIEKKMLSKRDTLVLPILYNARHAIELALKFVSSHLESAGLLKSHMRPNHDVRAYWKRLQNASLGDEKLSEKLRSLEPYVASVARIDHDGQELRYHLNRFSNPSLSDYSLANIEVIRSSLIELSEIIEVIKDRVISFIDERRTGLFTKRCSRRDLINIAYLLPRRDFWNSPQFSRQKAIIKTRYNLTNNQFSQALNGIQSGRETKAIIGLETALLYLADDEITSIIEQWRRIHPQSNESRCLLRPEHFDEASIEALKNEMAVRSEVISDLAEKYAGKKLAELQTMFHVGRDGLYPELYESLVEQKSKQLAAQGSSMSAAVYLMDKTNFLHSINIAATELGRLSLAAKLQSM